MMLIMLKGTLSRLEGLEFDLVKLHLKIILFLVFLNYQPVGFIMLLFIIQLLEIIRLWENVYFYINGPDIGIVLMEANVLILNMQIKALFYKTYFS